MNLFDSGEDKQIEARVRSGQRNLLTRQFCILVLSTKTNNNEEVKKSTLAKKIVIGGQFLQWDLILDALRKIQNVTNCWITITYDIDNALKAVAEYLSFSKVKKFTLILTPYDEFDQQFNYEGVVNAIKSNRYIEQITIGSQMEGYIKNFKPVFESVKAHPTIKQLQVTSFGLPDTDTPTMTEIIPNSVITTLCLTPGENDGRLKEYIDQLVNLTRVNKSLTCLKIEEGFAGHTTLGLLLDNMVLSKCPLEALHLSRFTSGFDREKNIGNFLAANLPLKVFGLRFTDLIYDNMHYIAEGLAQNNNLKVLDLRNSNVIDTVLPLLKTNRSITSVDFRGNSASEKTIESIAEVLKNNDTLRVLRFEARPNSSLNPIWDSLKYNQSLTELHITCFPLEEFTDLNLDSFKDVTEVNHSIIKLTLEHHFEIQSMEVTNLIQSFTERNKLEQRSNVTNTLQTIAMISKSKSFLEKFPIELWRRIYSFVTYPGVAMDFARRIGVK